MSPMQRREFLGAAGLAAATTAALLRPNRAGAGDPTFMNNVPDSLVSGKELPTFKFELEKSKGKVIGGSYGKEATVEQLPISKGIAGVSMKLEPGAMRELHWHATAAEWAFVIEGRVRTTVIDPQGNAETNDFGPGTVWYFPRGHGHMLECLEDKPTHFILIFDNGYFSEFGTFSITDWLGHTRRRFWRRTSASPSRPSRDSRRTRSISPAGRHRRRNSRSPSRGESCRHRRISLKLLEQAPHALYKGGREWRVDSSRFSDLEDDHRSRPRPRPGRAS